MIDDPEIRRRLAKLFRKLGSMRDSDRLRALSEVDRVLSRVAELDQRTTPPDHVRTLADADRPPQGVIEFDPSAT